jgi:NADPH:quinone reductase-like Zn-dependent oxidoreductase
VSSPSPGATPSARHGPSAGDAPGALDRIAGLVADGQLTVPIAATYSVERIREAVAFQAGRHVDGKVVTF